jgi:hypothetical protein
MKNDQKGRFCQKMAKRTFSFINFYVYFGNIGTNMKSYPLIALLIAIHVGAISSSETVRTKKSLAFHDDLNRLYRRASSPSSSHSVKPSATQKTIVAHNTASPSKAAPPSPAHTGGKPSAAQKPGVAGKQVPSYSNKNSTPNSNSTTESQSELPNNLQFIPPDASNPFFQYGKQFTFLSSKDIPEAKVSSKF